MSETNSVVIELVGGPCDGRMLTVKAMADAIYVPNLNRRSVVFVGENDSIPKTIWGQEVYRQRVVNGEPAMSGGAYLMDHQPEG